MAAHTEGAGLVSQSPRIDWHRKKSTNIHPYKTQLALGALLCKWDVAAGRRRSPSALQMSAGDGPGPSHASAHVRQLLKPPELGCVCASPPLPHRRYLVGGASAALGAHVEGARGVNISFFQSATASAPLCVSSSRNSWGSAVTCAGVGDTPPRSRTIPPQYLFLSAALVRVNHKTLTLCMFLHYAGFSTIK